MSYTLAGWDQCQQHSRSSCAISNSTGDPEGRQESGVWQRWRGAIRGPCPHHKDMLQASRQGEQRQQAGRKKERRDKGGIDKEEEKEREIEKDRERARERGMIWMSKRGVILLL